MHADKSVVTPYAVGTVQLDQGPLLRLPIVGDLVLEGPQSGQRGRLVTNATPDTGAALVFEVVDIPAGEGLTHD